MKNNDFKLGDKIIHKYLFWDRETKKEIEKKQFGSIVSFSFNYKEDNPLKIYTIEFEDGKKQNFIDRTNPESKKYFGWDINEITKIKN